MEALWERICCYLNGFEGRLCDVFPESIGDARPAAGIFVQSGGQGKKYLDGTVYLRIPFVLFLRINAYSGREKLNGLASLMGYLDYIRRVPLIAALEGGRIVGIRAVGVPYRSQVFADGGEEYKMSFSVDVRLDSPYLELEEEG